MENNDKQAESREMLRNGCVLVADHDRERISYLAISSSLSTTPWKLIEDAAALRQAEAG